MYRYQLGFTASFGTQPYFVLSGCGSSERSEDCDDLKDLCETPSINQQKVRHRLSIEQFRFLNF